MAFTPFGLAMWGPIAAATGLSRALWIAAAAWLAASGALLAVPEIRRLPRLPATALAASRGTR
jgi:hypothetical protein